MHVDVAEERRRSLARQKGEPLVDPGPTGAVLGAERVRASEPYVRQVREEVFGSPDPPWSSPEEKGAVAWATKRVILMMRGGKVPSELHQVDEAVQKVVRGTGFTPFDVENWILYGTPPTLHRAILSVRSSKSVLPDGTTLRHRSATITFNAPVTETEVRKMWSDRLRRVWDVDDPTDALRKRGPSMTELDYHLDQIVARLPLKDDSGSGYTWDERRKEWERTPANGFSKKEWREAHGKVSANALRVRWHRLEQKKEAHQPQPQED